MTQPDVLVLDDEIRVLTAIRRVLAGEAGLTVVTASEPEDALARLAENPPKVLITDYRMPRMNGVQVLTRARRIAPDTVRILLTAQAEKEQVIQAINAGKIYRFVGKPWDNEALQALVAEAIEVHESARRREEEFARTDKKAAHLEAAVGVVHEIQRSLFPTGAIQALDADAACRYTPCEHATGDYVDTVRRPDGRTALLVGDVCGHGLGAALFVFTARALLRSGLADGKPLSEVLARTNRFLCSDMTDGRFLTLFAGIHDPGAGTLDYVNAGHTPPLLRAADGSIRALRRTGMPLGVVESPSYDEVAQVPFEAGDTLLAYTDGIVEARNAEREFFGQPRLEELFEELGELDPADLVMRLRAEVHAFVDGAADDDVTVLAYRPLATAVAV